MQSLKEKRLEEFDEKSPIYIGFLDREAVFELERIIGRSLSYENEVIKKYLSDSIDMAYEEGKQQMADNIVEIIEKYKEKID